MQNQSSASHAHGVEEWRPVAGYGDRYEVSNLGRVRRRVPAPNYPAGYVLRVVAARQGYAAVRLKRGARGRAVDVHRLVAAAFLGPSPLGYEVNHIDGDKMNPALANLEYVTHRENVLHAFALGLRVPGKPPHHRGERNPAAKLTVADVLAIRASSESNVALGRRYGVSDQVVSAVRRRKTWTHV